MELTKIPDLSSAPKLVKLSLKGCTKLKELHGSVLSHKRLEFVNLSGCTHLQNLGRRKMEMEALMTLILSGCSNLEYVPEFGDNMKCLEHLYVDGTNIKNLPESMGKLCNLRKLDASETSIQEIPSSIRYLKRLRLLRVHRCQHSSQGRGFLFSKMNVLSAFIPANISLLSNLRVLCLNNCKRLQSLPKLSVVNEDTLYGLQMRYNYIISETRVDVSKFHAASNNTSPIVSCLNCPKVAENESGGHLAERILNGYLQLRSKYWTIPEAVFELVGAGSEIPSSFELLRADGSLTLEGPWIGVAICAVVALHHIDAAMETKYVVTAHVHVGENHWRIPVPISFLTAGLENQLVFYWTRADDFQRIVDSSQKNNFKFTFSVEPHDCKLEVTRSGVQFIQEKHIMQLKKLKGTTANLLHFVFETTLSPPSALLRHMGTCGPVTFLHSCYTSINHDLTRIITFICDYGNQQYTLDDMHKIIKRLIELNQGVLSECKEEWRHTKLFPLVYDYYRIIHQISELYNGFLRTLKDAFDSWLSVKLALEQILAKSRTDNGYSYREMLEQLNDLEAAEGIRFCHGFMKSFSFICLQTVAFSRHLNEEIRSIEKCKSMLTLVKVSSMTTACIFSILVTYICTDKQLQEMKGASKVDEVDSDEYKNSSNKQKSPKIQVAVSMQSNQTYVDLGFGQPTMVCGRYPYEDQYYGVFSAYGPQIKIENCLFHMIQGRIMLPLNLGSDDGPLFVNAKQYHGIIRRRRSRAKAEMANKVSKSRKVLCCTGTGTEMGNGHRYENGKRQNSKNQETDICKQTVGFTRQFNEEIPELKSVKVLAKVSSGLIAGVFSVMASYMVDCTPLQWAEEKTLTCVWFHLFRNFSWKSSSSSSSSSSVRKGVWLYINEFYDIDLFSQKLAYRLTYNKSLVTALVDELQQKVEKLLVTTEDMSRHARKCRDDIIKAGISLEVLTTQWF
ncbi:uncharacterized protein LOC143630671 [Bidens hawaiensis]|uniref:uncharacterized protein LOC143630671 n=1 Tax=Bidens hawaiensis TaxID=980011 RepID=UPI00404A3969